MKRIAFLLFASILAVAPLAAPAQTTLTLFTDIASGYPPSVYTPTSFAINWRGVVTWKVAAGGALSPYTEQDTNAAFLYSTPYTSSYTSATNSVTLTAPNGQVYTYVNVANFSETAYPANIVTFVSGGQTIITNLVWQYNR